MRNEIATFQGITAVVRSANLRTSLVEHEYQQLLWEVYPETRELMRASVSVPVPKLVEKKDEDGQKSYEPDQQDSVRYALELEPIIQMYPLANDHIQRIAGFVQLAARVTSINGASYAPAANGKFTKQGIALAYEDYLDSEFGTEEDPFPGIWGAILKAKRTVDAPLTPVEQRPPEALTSEELADPLL